MISRLWRAIYLVRPTTSFIHGLSFKFAFLNFPFTFLHHVLNNILSPSKREKKTVSEIIILREQQREGQI